MIKPKAEEDSFMQMEIYMKENGKRIRRTEGESIRKLMAQVILESGLRTSNMDSASRSGMTVHPMRGKTCDI